MENNKMYLTTAEAKAKGLGTTQEQIDRYNAALPKTTYVLRGLNADGKTFFYTGKAGEGWVAPNRDASFGYVSQEVAREKAKLFNGRVSLTGLWFVAVPYELTGQAAYEADIVKTPRYHDGGPRKTWEQLGEVEQWSWNRAEVK